MKKKIILIVLIMLGAYSSQAQDATIDWQSTIGGNGTDAFWSMDSVSNGQEGFVLGGASWSNASGDKTENSNGGADYWVVKVDDNGNIEWQNTVGSVGDDTFRTVLHTDNGYLVAGSSNGLISGDKTEDPVGSVDYWIVHLNESGVVDWDNTIGGDNPDLFEFAAETDDGGYILAGNSYSNISGDKTENSRGDADYWIVKLDSDGEIMWDKTIGGLDYEYLQAVQQTSDGGYILGGVSYSPVSGEKTEGNLGGADYWIVKLDASGQVEWDNTLGGTQMDLFQHVQESNDGGFIVGGSSNSNASDDKSEDSIGEYDFWVVKLDSSGNTEWENTIGGTEGEGLFRIIPTSDGGFVAGGTSVSDATGDKTEDGIGLGDYWIVKLSATGDIEWQETLGGSDLDAFRFIVEAEDGGMLVGGYSYSNISGDKEENSNGGSDYWIVKLGQILGQEDVEFSSEFVMYPNPSDGFLNLGSSEAIISEVKIFSAEGKLVSTYSEEKVKATLNISGLSSGMYFVQINAEGKELVKKLIVN